MTYLDPFIRPSYSFQQDNHPECVQLLGMIYNLTPAGAEGGGRHDSPLLAGSSCWAQELSILEGGERMTGAAELAPPSPQSEPVDGHTRAEERAAPPTCACVSQR